MFGEEVVNKVNAALGTGLSLEHFSTSENLPVSFESRQNFSECPGLVVAYASFDAVRRVVSCCDDVLEALEGVLGFDDYAFMGVARVKNVTLLELHQLAIAVHDSVFFCPDETSSIVLLDYYETRGTTVDEDHTIVVQGEPLVSKLDECIRRAV